MKNDLPPNDIAAPETEFAYTDAMMHTLVERSLCGILVVSREKIHFVNAAFEQITGYTKEDVGKMAPWDMVHPDAHDHVRAMGMERFKGRNIKDYYQTPWIHKDGRKIWMEVRATLLHDTNPPKILALVIDISERKKAREELEKREAELRSQSRKLEETNTALRVLLRQRNDEMEELRNNLLFNVEKLVMPHVEEARSRSDAHAAQGTRANHKRKPQGNHRSAYQKNIIRLRQLNVKTNSGRRPPEKGQDQQGYRGDPLYKQGGRRLPSAQYPPEVESDPEESQPQDLPGPHGSGGRELKNPNGII